MAIMLAVAKGIVETVKAMESVDPEIVPYFVDATDLYDTADPGLSDEAERRQEIAFLALDLVSGRVDQRHLLWPWLLRNGAGAADLEWFLDRAIALPVIGMNLYPMFTQKRLLRDSGGRVRIRMPYAGADLVTRLGRLDHDRYGAPLMISETASMGSLHRRLDWLDRSVAATRQLRGEGIPLVGYTWWPMFSLATWSYRQGQRPFSEHLARMGLWDIVPDEADLLRRMRTPAVEAYQRLVRSGTDSVGLLPRPAARADAGHLSK